MRPRAPASPVILLDLLRLAWPLALAGALSLINLAADRWWIGSAGCTSLAALGCAQAVLALLGTLFLGVAMAVLAGVAASRGAGRPDQAALRLGQGLLLALGLAGACALSAPFLAAPVLAWQGAPPSVAPAAAVYLQLGLVGTLFQGPLLAIAFALQGAGEARAALRVQAAAPLTALLLDPLLIAGCGLGLTGAALSALLANGLALLLAARTLRRTPALPLRWSALLPRRELLRQAAGLSAPGALEHLSRSAAALGLVALVAPFGAAVLSGYTAALTVVMLLLFPGLALGQAAASLVGRSLGAGDPARARQAAWVAAGLFAGFLGLGGLLCAGLGPGLIGLFDPNPASVREGSALLRALAPALPFLGVAMVLGKALGGAGRPLPALAAAALAHLAVQLPLAAFLSGRAGPAGAWTAMALAFGVQGALVALLFLRRFGPPELPRIPAPAWLPAAPRVVRVAAAGLACLGIGGCQTVDFTERRRLGDPIMALEESPAETHFTQKTRYSREGSAGGIGGSAGGGCGCY